MARSILVNGWNIPVRLQDFDFAEAARNGEVATGGFDMDSEAASVDVNSHWSVVAQETAAPAPHHLFHGYVADKEIARGPFAIASDRQFDVDTVDLNTLLIDDIITGASGKRPEESDITRVSWLVGTSFLSGMGATIGASGSTTLEASDFRTQNPLSLLAQAAETAGKLFFVYWDFVTEAPKLFYDLATASNFITSSKISTVLSDSSNALTHHPRKGSLIRRLSGGRIYSELLFKYDGGSVTVTNSATASNFRARKTVIYDNNVKSSAQATRKANQYLASVSTPEDVITLDVDLTAATINEFRAGQLMQIKAPHLGLPSFVDRRIVRTSRRALGDGDNVDSQDYRVTMELSVPKSNRFGSSGVPVDVLPDGAATTTTSASCASTTSRKVTEGEDWLAVYDQGVGSPGSGTIIASYVSYNRAYTTTGCPVGGGAWVGWHNAESWYTFTAEADTGSQLGYSVHVNTTGWTKQGVPQGYEVRVFKGAPSVGDYGKGAVISGGVKGVDVEYFIPRHFINWGGSTSIILSPTWQCAQDAFFCNPTGNFSFPVDDGRGMSGQWGSVTAGTACPVSFTASTTGLSPWVPGRGVTDGVNNIFYLISWDGSGAVTAEINGLAVPGNAMTLDTSALTVTLASPPPADSVVLFRYSVAA
jgi:hypothetical protein